MGTAWETWEGKRGNRNPQQRRLTRPPQRQIPLPGTQHRPPRQRRRSKTMFHHLFDWSAIDGISVSALPAVLLAAHARRARWLVVATCALCWLVSVSGVQSADYPSVQRGYRFP